MNFYNLAGAFLLVLGTLPCWWSNAYFAKTTEIKRFTGFPGVKSSKKAKILWRIRCGFLPLPSEKIGSKIQRHGKSMSGYRKKTYRRELRFSLQHQNKASVSA